MRQCDHSTVITLGLGPAQIIVEAIPLAHFTPEGHPELNDTISNNPTNIHLTDPHSDVDQVEQTVRAGKQVVASENDEPEDDRIIKCPKCEHEFSVLGKKKKKN